MSQIDEALDDLTRVRRELDDIERKLMRVKREQLSYCDKSIPELRQMLMQRWKDARDAQAYPKLYALQWLAREDAYNLARAAGFEKMHEAADFLNGVEQ